MFLKNTIYKCIYYKQLYILWATFSSDLIALNLGVKAEREIYITRKPVENVSNFNLKHYKSTLIEIRAI